MRRMRVGLAGLALLALLAGVCSCKKQETIVCGPTVFLYYGNTASEAVGKLEAEQNKPRKELAKKYETDAVLTDFLELNVLPAPKDGLFKGIPMDYEVGEFCLEMTLVSSQRHHFEVHYNYYQAELKLPGETEGEEVDFDRGKPVSHYQRRMRASGLQNASGYTNPAPTKIQAPKFPSCKFLGFLGVTGCAATSQ